MATMQDIADEVGISKAAVSRILNKKGSFSKKTIEQVLKSAKRLQYRLPSDLQLLEDEDFKIIAAVFPLMDNIYFSVLSSLLEQAAYNYGYSLMICSSIYDQEKEEVFFSMLRERKINGIIYGSFTEGISLESEEDLPIVTIGTKISDTVPTVRSDNYSAGVIAARHLASNGAKDLLYISDYHEGKNKDERYKGFKDEANKLDVNVSSYFTYHNNQSKDVAGIITQMLIDHPEADGIFAEHTSLAIQCLKICNDLGLEVPKDLKLVGFSSPYASNYSFPEISNVMENTRMIAEKAIGTLVDLIENNTVKELETIVPVSLERKQTS